MLTGLLLVIAFIARAERCVRTGVPVAKIKMRELTVSTALIGAITGHGASGRPVALGLRGVSDVLDRQGEHGWLRAPGCVRQEQAHGGRLQLNARECLHGATGARRAVAPQHHAGTCGEHGPSSS